MKIRYISLELEAHKGIHTFLNQSNTERLALRYVRILLFYIVFFSQRQEEYSVFLKCFVTG